MIEDRVMTATKEELTLMLYEGGIRFLNMGIESMQKNDLDAANKHLQRTQDIVREFQMTLNHKYPIAQEMDTLYDYMHRRLVEGNMKKDLEILDEVLTMFREFRDTWKGAMKVARAEG
jgi:flagellar protein FliS